MKVNVGMNVLSVAMTLHGVDQQCLREEKTISTHTQNLEKETGDKI